MLRALLPVVSVGLAGCAAAQMQVPRALAGASMRTEIVGIGGWPSGAFTAGPYSGRFERSLNRYSFSDATITRAGHSHFTLTGPSLAAPLEGHCGMSEQAVDFGLAEVTMQPMAYRCELPGGILELQETVGRGSAMTRYERHGSIALDGTAVRFHSVHHLAGTRLPSLTPVGYVFEHRGRQVAALELTGRPALIADPALDAATARAVHVAAVALAIFWDPAVHDAES